MYDVENQGTSIDTDVKLTARNFQKQECSQASGNIFRDSKNTYIIIRKEHPGTEYNKGKIILIYLNTGRQRTEINIKFIEIKF